MDTSKIPWWRRGLDKFSGEKTKKPPCREINNPFINAPRPEVVKDGKVQFYMYTITHGGETMFVFQNPDNFKWYIAGLGQAAGRKIKDKEVGPTKVKIKYFNFSQIFDFKPSSKELETDKRIKEYFEGIGVDLRSFDTKTGDYLGDYIILKENPFSQSSDFPKEAKSKYLFKISTYYSPQKSVLRFANYKIAKEFFRRVLYYISYYPDYKNDTHVYMQCYFELLRRFNPETLEINMENFLQDNKGVNYMSEVSFRAFNNLLAGEYQFMMKKYQDRIKVFPELWKNKNFKTWADEGKKWEFFKFCKAHMKPEAYKKLKEQASTEGEEFVLFAIEAEKNEVRLGCGIYDALCTRLNEFNFLYPADTMKKIMKFVDVLGPHLDDPKRLREFFAKYNFLIKSGYYIPMTIQNFEGGRVILIKNDPKVRKELDRLVKKLNFITQGELVNSPDNYHEMDPVNMGFSALDKIISPAIVNIANYPPIADNVHAATKHLGVDGSKFVYLLLRSVYMQLRGIGIMLNFKENPYSWLSFLAGIQDFPEGVANLIYGLTSNDEMKVVDSLSLLVGLFFESHSVLQYIAKKTKKPFLNDYLSKVIKEEAKTIKEAAIHDAKTFRDAVISKWKNFLKSPAGKKALARMMNSANVILRFCANTAKLKQGGARSSKLRSGKTAKTKPKAGRGRIGKIGKTVKGQIVKQTEKTAAAVIEKAGARTIVKEALKEAEKTLTKPKGVLGIIGGGVVLGAVINVLTEGEACGGSLYNEEKLVSKTYRARYTEAQFDKTFELYEKLYKPKTEKDYRKFFAYPNIYIFTEYANTQNKAVLKLSDDMLKMRIELDISEGRANLPVIIEKQDTRRVPLR